MSGPDKDIPAGPRQDLISLLAVLRARRNQPTYEAIAARIPSQRGRKTSRGNLQEIFSGKKIPSGDMAMAIVRALDGSAAEETRARQYAESAAALRPPRGSTVRLGSASDVTQLSLPPFGGLLMSQVPPAPGESAGPVVAEALPSISIDPPLEHLPPLLHGRRLITSELVDHLNAFDDASPELMLWVLHGMGGAGKSAVALSVAEHCAVAGIDVFWISVNDTTQLTSGMRELAVRLAQPGSPLRSGSIADAAWQALNRAERPWLLVLDAADDPAVFKPGGSEHVGGAGWIRPSSRGVVLVTSRLGNREIWGSHARLRKVSPLSARYGAWVVIDQFDERMRLAVSRETQGAVAAAEALSDRLGGLPLALRAAGRYLTRAVRVDPDAPELPSDLMGRYTAQLDDEFSVVDRAVLATARGGQPAERDLVTATWRVSLGLLEPADRAEAARVLSVMACLAAAPLPVDVVITGLWAEPDDRSDARLLLASLEDLALLEIGEGNADEIRGGQRVVTMHRSVHDSIQADFVRRLDPGGVGAYFSAAVELLRLATRDLDPLKPETHPRWSLLVPHVLAVLADLDRLAEADVTDLLDMSLGVSSYLVATGEGEEAERVADRVLQASRDNSSAAVGCTLRAQRVLAGIYLAAGDSSRAESILQDLITTSADDAEEMILSAQRALGQIYSQTGRYPEAEQVQREVLEKSTAREGEASPTTLIDRLDLATTIAKQGDYVTAADELRTVASALGFAVGHEYEGTLLARRNLASCLVQAGRAAEAIAEMEQLLPILERQSGADAPDVLTFQADIALAYRGIGDLTEAETRLRRVVATFERTNEPLWPRCGLALNALAIVLLEKGQAEEAKRILLRLVEAVADARGSAHPETTVVLQNLAAAAEQTPLTEDEREFLYRTGLFDGSEDERVTVMKRIIQELEGDTDALPGELLDARIALHELSVATGVDQDQIASLREQIVGDDLVTSRFAHLRVRHLVLEDAVAAPNGLAVRRYEDYLATLGASERLDDELGIRHELARLLQETGHEARALEEYADILQRSAEKFGLNHLYTTIAYLNSGAGQAETGEFICDAAQAITEFMDSWNSDQERFRRMEESWPAEERSMVWKLLDLIRSGVFSGAQGGTAVLSGILCIRAFTMPDGSYGDALLAWRNFGHTLLKEDLPDIAERFLRDLLVVSIARKGVHSPEANATELLLLQTLFQLGRFDEVIAECTQLLPYLRDESDVQDTRHLLTLALLATGDIDRASTVIRKVPVEARSADIGIELELADAFRQSGRTDDALVHLGRLLMIDARNCGAYSENSLSVMARIERAIGEEVARYANEPWFADYQRISSAFYRTFPISESHVE